MKEAIVSKIAKNHKKMGDVDKEVKKHHQRHSKASHEMSEKLDSVVKNIQDASELFKQQSELMLQGALSVKKDEDEKKEKDKKSKKGDKKKDSDKKDDKKKD